MITDSNRAAFFNNFIPWKLDLKTGEEGSQGGGRTYFDSLKTYQPFINKRKGGAKKNRGYLFKEK